MFRLADERSGLGLVSPIPSAGPPASCVAGTAAHCRPLRENRECVSNSGLVHSTRDSRSRPTMRDVAAAANVSIKSVSRVINAETYVSEALKARVLTAIDQLHYACNIYASGLRRPDGRSQTIALVMEEMASPFSSGLINVIQDDALDRGVLVFVGRFGEDVKRERKLMDALTGHRVDGLVIVAGCSDYDDQIDVVSETGTPVIFVNACPPAPEFDCVVTDDVAGARTGVRHLVARGHSQIAYIGGPASRPTARLRYQGYAYELSSQSVCVDAQQVRVDIGDADAAQAAAVALLSQPHRPTALFTGDTYTTLGTSRAIGSLGLDHEVAQVGFDDCLLPELIDRGVTVLARDPVATGRRAATLLFRRVEGDRSPGTRETLVAQLISRGSGEIVFRQVA